MRSHSQVLGDWILTYLLGATIQPTAGGMNVGLLALRWALECQWWWIERVLWTVSGRGKDGKSEECAHDPCWPWLVVSSAVLQFSEGHSEHPSLLLSKGGCCISKLGLALLQSQTTPKSQWFIQAFFIHLPYVSDRLTAGLLQVTFTLGPGWWSGRLGIWPVLWQTEKSAW